MKLAQKFQFIAMSLLATPLAHAADTPAATTTTCGAASNDSGSAFFTAVLNFIGSPVFYMMMFLLALGGLYSAIVKQDTKGWWAVGFAAVGAASPQIFVKISEFACGVMGGIVT